MKKIFANEDNLNLDSEVIISGDDHYHLSRVLRVKTGDSFIIGNKTDSEYIGEVRLINKSNTILKLNSIYKRKTKIKPLIKLYFCVLKGDKNDFIIRKCSEIGIDVFIPVISKYCIIKSITENKIKRWNKIAREASMQSGRMRIPEILDIKNISDIQDDCDLRIFGEINNKNETVRSVSNNIEINSLSILIGPEGDLSADEMNYLWGKGWKGVKLIDNILTSEAAAIFMSSVFVAEFI